MLLDTHVIHKFVLVTVGEGIKGKNLGKADAFERGF